MPLGTQRNFDESPEARLAVEKARFAAIYDRLQIHLDLNYASERTTSHTMRPLEMIDGQPTSTPALVQYTETMAALSRIRSVSLPDTFFMSLAVGDEKNDARVYRPLCLSLEQMEDWAITQMTLHLDRGMVVFLFNSTTRSLSALDVVVYKGWGVDAENHNFFSSKVSSSSLALLGQMNSSLEELFTMNGIE